MCGGRITTSSAPGQVMEINWADEDRDQAHEREPSWFQFRGQSEKEFSPMLWAHWILFSFPFPLLPLKYKTKSTPTPSPNLKKCSHTVQNPHIRTLCLHSAEDPKSWSIVTRKETLVQNSEHTLPSNTKTNTPHYSPSSCSQRKLPQHRSPGPSYGTTEPSKRERLQDRSISAVRQGECRRRKSHIFSEQPHRSSMQLSLNGRLCYGPYPVPQEASRSRTIFYSPEISATPLLYCFGSLGSIQTQQ